jgi:hypothetical protein
MLVRTRLAAVCPIAYCPAIEDLPNSSPDGFPVTGSLGGNTDIPKENAESAMSLPGSKPLEMRCPPGLTVSDFFPTHETDVDASRAGYGSERNQFTEESFRGRLESA